MDIPFSEIEKTQTDFLFVYQLCLYLSARSISVDACFLGHSLSSSCWLLPHNRASAVSYTFSTALSPDIPLRELLLDMLPSCIYHRTLRRKKCLAEPRPQEAEGSSGHIELFQSSRSVSLECCCFSRDAINDSLVPAWRHTSDMQPMSQPSLTLG